VENRWWVYKTEFILDGGISNAKKISLIFKGVDYKCHIFFNGQKLCEHEGMYDPIRCDISNKINVEGINTLEVVIEAAPEEMSQIGYTSKVKTQKSRFNYKWDFSTRLVHMGIWDDVYIKVNEEAEISDIYVKTDLTEGVGIIEADIEISAQQNTKYVLKAYLSLKGELIEALNLEDEGFNTSKKMRFVVKNPLIWWPNGHGEQPLYQLFIQVMVDGNLSDECYKNVGIRKLEYERNEGSSEESLSYILKINGKRIYIKGVNLTPIDLMYGGVSQERYTSITQLLKNANINLVRVWGGGIIEKDSFYELCDQKGILVWQEFIQSSSGIDNVPPKDQRYMELLKRSSLAAIIGRRSHTCLAYWSGGNELRGEGNERPADFHDENIKVLQELVKKFDPIRMFLPTSASGPNEFLNISPDQQGKNHDVHGPWKYEGITLHYQLYNQSDSLLHSEFGVDGFTNLCAVKKFLSMENRTVSSVKDNKVWRHHGEWWDTTKRDNGIFGAINSLNTQIKCSQFIQAEGLRYAVESNRRRKYMNSGSIIWQFNEPWPNLFCTNIVDYYEVPKMAYYWVKKVFADTCISLQYERLKYCVGEEFYGCIYLNTSTHSMNGNVNYQILDMKGNVHKKGVIDFKAQENKAILVGEIKFVVENYPEGIFFISLFVEENHIVIADNLYMFSTIEDEIYSPLLKTELKGNVEIIKTNWDKNCVTVANDGVYVALFIKLEALKSSILWEDNYFTLFPGQKKSVGYISQTSYQPEEISIEWLNM